MVAVPLIIGFLCLFIVTAIARGFALSYLWQWFLVPFGLPSISIAWAIGLSLIIGYLTHEGAEKEKKDLSVKIFTALLTPFFVLLIGYIIHLFM